MGAVAGIVYPLHSDPPFKHARHYIGWTRFDVQGRVQYHVDGRGSRLVYAAVLTGCDIKIARTWKDQDRNLERTLKNRKNAPGLCPLCRVDTSSQVCQGGT